MKELEKIAEALARSMGHDPQCKKVKQSAPCDCGAGAQQAKALDDYQQWKTEKEITK